MRKTYWVAAILCIVLIVPTFRIAEASVAGSYIVNADNLNVRSEPSKSADVIGKLNRGERVEVTKESYGWYRIDAGSVEGWVAGYYLKKASEAKSGKASTAAIQKANHNLKQQGTVTADSLRVREGPGTSHPVIAGLKQGDKLTVLKADNGWLNIRVGGTTGWVSQAYVEMDGAAPAVQTASVSRSSGKLQGKLIVIDPGHGGDDPGMIGTTLETIEKELNLKTAKLLRDELAARGAKVIMTRTKDDSNPKLSERVDISERNAADAFISIHYNSSQKNTSGTLAFYYADKDELLARAIAGRLADGIGLKNNGVSFGNYHVLRENDRPAALLELGFLSNAKDEKMVRTEQYQRNAVVAIANGLADYFAGSASRV
jgi:N-acetylmuramoyl-L-alanine amidase